jgi:cardiolipin synthase
MSGPHLVAGNQLTLLQNGEAFFPQLCQAIEAARHSIYLETYIFAADAAGRMVADALQRAAARGVAVRMLLDGFGSAELPQGWVDDLRMAGVEVQWFRRATPTFILRRSRKRRLLRLHRKLAVMDGQTAFAGGINIIDDIPAHSGLAMPRLDYAVRAEGPVVGEIHASMRHLWAMVAWAHLRRRSRDIKRLVMNRPRDDAVRDVTLLLRDNLRHRRDIERAYLEAIAGAREEIIIACAYFLPGRVFRRALKRAARRGVQVVLLLQGKVEYRLQHYATHALYGQLLAAGVEIHEYQASYLHAKVAVVDGQWATVGSSNIDPFSLLLAREANLAIRDAGFAAELRGSLMAAIGHDAIRISAEHCAARNIFSRLIARASYGVVRMLVGMLGHRRRGT